MITRLPTTKARARFSEILNAVGYRKKRVMLQRHGKNVAAVVPAEDLELLEELENTSDLAAARAAIKERGRRVPFEELEAELGL